jgi:hypothetical protein
VNSIPLAVVAFDEGACDRLITRFGTPAFRTDPPRRLIPEARYSCHLAVPIAHRLSGQQRYTSAFRKYRWRLLIDPRSVPRNSRVPRPGWSPSPAITPYHHADSVTLGQPSFSWLGANCPILRAVANVTCLQSNNHLPSTSGIFSTLIFGGHYA